MSDSNLNYEGDADNQGNPDSDRASKHKKLEARNKELEASNAEGLAAKRELLFIKAGVPTDSKMAGYFIKGYEGELSVDAIRAAAIEATIIEPKTDPTLEAEQATAQRIASARVAGESSSVVPDFQAEVDSANSPGELDKIVARQNAGKSA